jgi:class 3 adenylate cyclase
VRRRSGNTRRTLLRGHLALPQSYTPKHLAERILTSKTALEGERKQVTVLFCDIVESTRQAERLDPEAIATNSWIGLSG